MRKRIAAILAAITALAMAGHPAAQNQPRQVRYVVDDSRSAVEARVPFLGLAHRTARFPDMSGTISFAIDDYEAVDMNFVVDARTLTTGDSQTARLRGRHFFDVARHPTVSFTGHHIRFTSTRTAQVTGEMTARGVTRPASVAVTFSSPPMDSGGTMPLTVEATTRIDRRQFGMTAFPLIIGNDVDVTIHARVVPG